MKACIGALMCFLVSLACVVPAAADRDYKGRPGYKERPYDKHRHYDYQQHRGNRYAYRGHWRSWHEWDDYARHYPRMHKHGGYYWEGSHLMFRFCDPDSSSCFFFSIGR